MTARWRRPLLAATVAIGLALLATYVALPALARGTIAEELAASGFPHATFRVHRVGLGGVQIAELRLAPDLVVDEVDVDLDLLAGRVDVLTLRGARWTVTPTEEGLRSSAIATLFRRPPSAPSDRGPRRIRLVRSQIVLERPSAPIVVEIDGALDPVAGEADLELRSELGVHALAFSSTRSNARTIVRARLRSRSDDVRADARVELVAGGASLLLSARADAIVALGVAIDRARIDGWAAIDEGRITELSLRAESAGARVGELALESASLDAALEGGSIALRASAEGKEGLEAHAGSTLPRELAHLSLALDAGVAWELTGPIPAAMLERRARGIVLTGDPRVRASGLVRRTRGAWTLERIDGEAEIVALELPGIGTRLDDVRVDLKGLALAGDRAELAVVEGSRITAARVRIEDLHLTELDLAPTLRVRGGEDGVRVHTDDEVHAHVRSLAVGTGDSALRFDDVDLILTSRGGAPIVELGGGRGRVGLDMRAVARRVRGILVGGRTEGSAGLEVELLPGETRIALPLDLRSSNLREPNSEIALEDTRVRLPLRWERDVFGADGRIESRAMSWRGVPVGPGRGALRLSSDWVRLTWRGPATPSSSFDASARIALGDDVRGAVRIIVPRSIVRGDDPLSRVLAALTELRVEGPVEGELELDVAAPERGDGWLRMQGAAIEDVDGSGRARDVHGTLRFTSFDPLVSAGAPLIWGELELGDFVRTGAGSASLRFERSGDIAVSEMTAAVGGGRVDLAPFRFDWDAPDLALDLTVHGIELRRLASALTGGRVSATGRIDGRVALRVQLGEGGARVLLGDGRLAARDPGGFRIGDGSLDPEEEEELAGLVEGRWIERRVLGALADFEYRVLELSLDDPGGTRRLSARVLGRGKRMPQELDLTLNVRGIQPLLDHALRLWPTGTADAIMGMRDQ